jgi:hypothetical protein
LYRQNPDSSVLPAPRTFTRVFCDPGTLVETVNFYRRLTATDFDMDMDIPEAGLHVVAVGGFLILELDRQAHAEATRTHATVLAPHLKVTADAQLALGTAVVQEMWNGPAGPGIRLRHPDGLIVEYLEHRPTENDVDAPGDALRERPTP